MFARLAEFLLRAALLFHICGKERFRRGYSSMFTPPKPGRVAQLAEQLTLNQ